MPTSHPDGIVRSTMGITDGSLGIETARLGLIIPIRQTLLGTGPRWNGLSKKLNPTPSTSRMIPASGWMSLPFKTCMRLCFEGNGEIRKVVDSYERIRVVAFCFSN